MSRYAHLRRLAPLGGVAAAAILALSAAPAGATIVCQPGRTPPTPPATSPYCVNIKPTAITGRASNVKGTSATLNGIAGPAVAGGDPTQYFFQFGTTSSYGRTTITRTLGSCPAGKTPPSKSCTTPKQAAVSADIGGLTPCTTYHDRLVAQNADGETEGADSTFTTGFAKPIEKVKFNKKVKHNHKFKVTITLRYRALVKIFIKTKNGKILEVYKLGTRDPGTFKKKDKAPGKKGTYKLNVFARLPCGTQSVKKKLHVK